MDERPQMRRKTTHVDQSRHLSHKLVPVHRPQRPVAIRVTMYGLDDRSTRPRLSESRPASLRHGGNWDLAFHLLPHGGAVAGPPVDDGSGFFTGADATLG